LTLRKIAYISLWFPKPSETFVLREVVNLWKLGLPLEVFTTYGELTKSLSPEMLEISEKVRRLGIPFLKRFPRDLAYWWKKDRRMVLWLFKTIPVRKWRSFEVAGENIWAFLCGFTLARLFEDSGIDHIHAVWANGPATAAWVSGKLSGIPYSFTGRAVDIYPSDGALEEKIRDAAFVITDNMTNVPYLQQYCPRDPEKIYGIYNGLPLERHSDAAVKMRPPFQLLAIGRFDRIKAFHMLIYACRILKDSGVAFHLTLVGDGWRKYLYKFLSWRLGISGLISYPGYVTYDKVSEFFSQADVFVMSSAVHRTGERDGLPTVIMEAFMHRLPVVSTDVCGIKEVVQNGITGYIAPENDPAALAGAIIDMLSDRGAAIEMADRGRDLVAREFDQTANHGKIFDLLVGKAV
jgi:colanic acid/amylovoran biosynthesis glycosyltransferase